jgi:hypothetical protein
MPHALVRLEGLCKLIKFIQLIGSRTRDLPACNVVHAPQNRIMFLEAIQAAYSVRVTNCRETHVTNR